MPENIAGSEQMISDWDRNVRERTDAYGIICQPFRMMLDPVEQHHEVEENIAKTFGGK